MVTLSIRCPQKTKDKLRLWARPYLFVRRPVTFYRPRPIAHLVTALSLPPSLPLVCPLTCPITWSVAPWSSTRSYGVAPNEQMPPEVVLHRAVP